MTRTSEEDCIQVVLVDQPIEVNVREAQSGARPPVAEETLLDVLVLQRFTQQRIAPQVDHPGREIGAGPPVRIDFA